MRNIKFDSCSRRIKKAMQGTTDSDSDSQLRDILNHPTWCTEDECFTCRCRTGLQMIFAAGEMKNCNMSDKYLLKNQRLYEQMNFQETKKGLL